MRSRVVSVSEIPYDCSISNPTIINLVTNGYLGREKVKQDRDTKLSIENSNCIVHLRSLSFGREIAKVVVMKIDLHDNTQNNRKPYPLLLGE